MTTGGQSQMEPRTRARAKAKITVRVLKPSPTTKPRAWCEMEIRLNERFIGDIKGESPIAA